MARPPQYLDSTSFEMNPWSEGWSRRTLDFNAVEYTFPAGHQLELAVTVDASAGADMLFAYGTASQAAHLLITQRTDWPVYFLDTIGAPAVWAQGYEGDNVRVAVIDSGAQKGIKDLKEGSVNAGHRRSESAAGIPQCLGQIRSRDVHPRPDRQQRRPSATAFTKGLHPRSILSTSGSTMSGAAPANPM